MSLDEIMERLERGDTIMLDDQWRTYISLETTDLGKSFVTRSILAAVEDHGKRVDMPATYEEKRYDSLVEALLSLLDWEWRKPGGTSRTFWIES